MAAITPEFFTQARSHWRANSNFRVDINGTTPGSGYDQLNVNDRDGVTITGSNLVVTVGTTLSVGQTFTILIKNSTGPITGTFAGIPKGVPWRAATVPFSRSVTPEAMATTSCSQWSQRRSPNRAHGSAVRLRLLGVAFTQRRRLRKTKDSKNHFPATKQTKRHENQLHSFVLF